MLCGECKAEVVEVVLNFLKNHQERREAFIDEALRIVEEGEHVPSYL